MTHVLTRLRILPRLSIALIAVAISACGAATQAPGDPVNLVILSIDTLRPDHLGFYGYPRPTTRRLDAFAATGVVFDQAVTVHVATAPAHGTVLTGRYPGSHGITRNGMRLSPGVPTLAGTLSDLGWATGGFVSGWTLERHTGLDRGFDRYDDDLGSARNGARRDGAATTDAAIEWLEDQVAGERRFFLFLHLFEPHWPYDPPAGFALRFLPGRYELTTVGKPVHLDRRLSVNRLTPAEQDEYVARYDGEIVVADRLAGRLLDALDDLGVAGRTAVVFLSDHGETLFEREWTMDHGARPYDEQARVPLVVNLPGGLLEGRRVPDQVSLLDVVPTVFEIFDIPISGGLKGRSLLPLARGDASESSPRPAFVTARSQPERVPHIQGPLVTRGLVCAIRLPGIKLIEFPLSRGNWEPELHDLVDDPGELVDVSQTRPDTAMDLHGELERWRRTTSVDANQSSPELDPEVESALRELGYISD